MVCFFLVLIKDPFQSRAVTILLWQFILNEKNKLAGFSYPFSKCLKASLTTPSRLVPDALRRSDRSLRYRWTKSWLIPHRPSSAGASDTRLTDERQLWGAKGTT